MHIHLILAGGLFLTVLLSYIFQEKYIGKISVKEYIIAATASLLLLFWFMGHTGVLGSGYHFVDDHEIYTIGKDFLEYGFWGTMYKWITNDLHSRFRFTYFLIRVTECYFFGDNFVLWHVFQTVTAAVSLFLSYVFARRMKCTVWVSYIFAVAIFIGGGQSAVWWRLGPQENLGIILLMLTLLSLRSYVEKNKTSNLVLSIILTVLLAGIKEAFLLLLPLLPIWVAYWEISQNQKKISVQKICLALKKRWIYFLVTYVVFAIDIAIILLYVGTNKIGYSGIDSSYRIRDYVTGVAEIVNGRLGLYIKISVIGIVFLLTPAWILYIREQRKFWGFLNSMIIPALLFGYFCGSQMILHVKSGMYERYLLPVTVAFAYFWLIDVYHFFESKKCFLSGYYMFTIFMALALITGVNDEERACIYAEDGKNTTAMLNYVAEHADENSNVVVGIGYEEDFSASVYLQEKCNINSTYNLFYSTRENNIVRDGYVCNENERAAIALDEVQIFIGYSHNIGRAMEEVGLSQDDFEISTFGEYLLCVKR